MNFFVSEKFSKLLIFIGVFLLLTFIICFGYKSVFFDLSVPIKTDVFGQFGDIVGGVIGSLWALAGVILFYAGLTEQRKDIKTNQEALERQISALNYQKEEMELQREEYKMARTVFEEQREALKEQAKTARIQQFESNFYALLNVYIDIRNHIFYGGDNFIKKVNDSLLDNDLRSINEIDKITIINDKYMEIYMHNKDNISHYLKTIYRIYKVIDEQQDLTVEKKYFYSKIIRSQFMEHELFLIYYNSHSHYGLNFRSLILKFNILKHLTTMSKVEFNYLDNSNMTICNQRNNYFIWLDSFLIDYCEKIYDLEMVEPSFSSVFKIDKGPYESIIEMKINDNDDIELIFTNDLYEVNKYLGLRLEEEYINLMKHYLCDRIINNNFKRKNDYIINYKKDNNDFVFTIETDDEIKIVSDSV